MYSGTIIEIFVEGGVTKARVTCASGFRVVSLLLMFDARVGDDIMIDSDLAVSHVGEEEAVL